MEISKSSSAPFLSQARFRVVLTMGKSMKAPQRNHEGPEGSHRKGSFVNLRALRGNAVAVAVRSKSIDAKYFVV
ncbi:MAG TPA: hypothetical protein VFO46_09590 [Candidatus Sulfotelmatobacter sp.]|jgi:hypothetical protein|nr:hypothetical protein [Candidatus Sulfotelmatobacter sp.]